MRRCRQRALPCCLWGAAGSGAQRPRCSAACWRWRDCLLWTPTHYDTLYGLQGRYFLPVLPLVLLTCLPRGVAHVSDEDTAAARLLGALALTQFAC